MEEQKKGTSKIWWLLYLIVVVLVGVLVYRMVVIPKGDVPGDQGHSHSRSDAVADDSTEYTIEQIISKRRGWDPIMTNIYGKTAPDFTVKTLDGKDFKLSDHAGKEVFVIYWGTWCGFCVKEIPHLIALRKEMQASDLEIVAISDEGKSTVESFISKKGGVNYTLGLSSGSNFRDLPSPYGSIGQYGRPAAMFIGKDGKFKLATVGAQSLTEMKRIIRAKK